MKDITIHFNLTIKEAMEILDKTAQQVLLVVDKNKVLVGSLTDGDVRRYILSGRDLSGTIEHAYHRNPIVIFENDYNLENIKQLLLKNKVSLIPILDQKKRVIDYITWEKAFGTESKEEKKKIEASVVIMAGGKGTRLEPFTKVLPKPLIPIDGKPIIDHIIDRFRDYGINDFYLTIHHMSRILRAYFEEKNPEYTMGFAEENEPRGTAGSLKLIKDKISSPFFVSNCDIIIKADYYKFYNFHKKGGYDITLVAAAKQFNIPYGVCKLKNKGNLDTIKEKPEYNFLVNTGMYILNSNILEMIPDDGLFHITQLIDKVNENKGNVGVYPVNESAWVDVGQWAEYRKALKTIEQI